MNAPEIASFSGTSLMVGTGTKNRINAHTLATNLHFQFLTVSIFNQRSEREKSSLHYLLPNKRDINIVNRLRHAKTFELSQTQTERFKKSFIPYSLAHFQ